MKKIAPYAMAFFLSFSPAARALDKYYMAKPKDPGKPTHTIITLPDEYFDKSTNTLFRVEGGTTQIYDLDEDGYGDYTEVTVEEKNEKGVTTRVFTYYLGDKGECHDFESKSMVASTTWIGNLEGSNCEDFGKLGEVAELKSKSDHWEITDFLLPWNDFLKDYELPSSIYDNKCRNKQYTFYGPEGRGDILGHAIEADCDGDGRPDFQKVWKNEK